MKKAECTFGMALNGCDLLIALIPDANGDLMTVHRKPETLPTELREKSFILEESEKESEVEVEYYIEDEEADYIVEEVIYCSNSLEP